MTQIAINKTVEAIINATKNAVKSKETAQKFLQDAGIIKASSTLSTSGTKTSTKK